MGIPLTAPSPGINYNFVAGGYFVCTLLLGLFLALDKLFAIKAVEGVWIVFAPFAPCLLWAMAIRSQWLKARGSSSSAGGSDKPKED